MPRKSNARQKLVETAAKLFQARGYHASGLTLILEESGAPKGSFYYHFPGGKEQLAESAMAMASQETERQIDEAFAQASSFNDGVRNLARILADWFEKSDYREGCPVASILLETVPESERLGRSAQAVFETWISMIETHAQRLGCGERAHEHATRLFMALEGAWLLARAQRSTAPFEIVARQFADAAD